MPSSNATVVLATRKEQNALVARALAVGLNVDTREISGAPLLPFEVTIHGRHDEGVSLSSLTQGLQHEVASFVFDPND